jgi:deoxyribonuclease V
MKKPGLGKHLYDSLEQKIEVIDVAKKAFLGINENHRIFRGSSKKPLYITSTENLEDAKKRLLLCLEIHEFQLY